ncbi:MAG: ornithine carbamoyltransferase [Spirochaetes bacterium]|nr:ornithine carbamoyltransferase [Deltaproteobacteria bacterium]RKY03874.1 MAG: ornithine carbamoyltransferase [Spirochaetota bacterium]
MKDKFLGRDFLTVMDYTKEEVLFILDTAADLKRKWTRREPHEFLKGRTIAMIFEKRSTRTRVSFQAAIAHLGAQSFYMKSEETQLGRGEPIKDTARVIDRYCDALVMRTFGQEILEEFAKYMRNPVINALSDLTHPCQLLADLLTIREKKGEFKGLKMAFSGDIWNVFHSNMIGCAMMGMDFFAAMPDGYEPSPVVLNKAKELASASGAKIVFSKNMDEIMEGADVVYANTYHSMGGPEKNKEQRVKDFAPFQVNEEAMKKAKDDAIFMHCLPGYRGEEMTDEVIEGPHSVVFDEAENRMHTEKAILSLVTY